MHRTGARGFSLLEVLFAATILTVALGAIAQLFAIAARSNAGARTTTMAALLAAEKMERLRSLAWTIDAAGLAVSDTTSDGTGLTPSPPGALAHNAPGYCDFLDTRGAPLGAGPDPPAGAAFTRRWSIEPLPTNPNNTLVLQVAVARRGRDEVRLVSVKTRKVS